MNCNDQRIIVPRGKPESILYECKISPIAVVVIFSATTSFLFLGLLLLRSFWVCQFHTLTLSLLNLNLLLLAAVGLALGIACVLRNRGLIIIINLSFFADDAVNFWKKDRRIIIRNEILVHFIDKKKRKKNIVWTKKKINKLFWICEVRI